MKGDTGIYYKDKMLKDYTLFLSFCRTTEHNHDSNAEEYMWRVRLDSSVV